jgi:two-component system, LytTR family, sensor kinase
VQRLAPQAAHLSPMRRGSFLMLSLIVFAASAVVALVDTAMSLVRVPENTFAWEFPRLLLAWLTLGVFAPVVVLAAYRVRFGRTNAAVAIAIHGILAFLCAGAHYALLALIHRWLLNNTTPYWRAVRDLFLYYAHFDVIAYALIVGCVHAWMSHAEARERELAAQTLRADLSEARLRALRSQLHPHFLFNAMNAIAMLVRSGNQEAAVGTLAKLSDLFRRVIRENPGHQVPLREEIDFATDYLDIERTRFGDRLTVSIDAPDDTLDVLVPDLVLQPLVENAMRHGVAQTSRRCHLSIVARRSNGQLTLRVSDDAKGLSPERPSDNPGVGLANTRARLDHLHGSDARLSVANNEEGGVTAQIILPVSLHRPRASLLEPAH